MSKKEMVRKIMEAKQDEFFGRLYPDDWIIAKGVIYIATLDPAKEYNAPELIVQSVDEFIEQNEEYLYCEDEDES